MEIINFSAELTASDSERRIIGGQIVPFEKIGSTNVGKVVFEKGSIQIDPSKRQKLLLEQDRKSVV